ncbi:PepSY-associated TM helix domain-containing protein [Oceanimonas pelagia]|uniref:PepSY-associated TM helix domain-containing protein n=1 Tax=Oceanimonas pelagia TaxID=3028314 RepID=A0AA50KN24_9GAMM|nr:PepSY-associated TM helix domain-containing protein [Oceanimonas pelagia]WMC10830.1 PepSY-associated TM helix domain-containing protein [Oceanimonas pelagia]
MAGSSTRFAQAPRWVRPVHTYSSMLMLLIMLFFTATGLTLNNRQWLPEAEPEHEAELELPGLLAGTALWQQDPMLAAGQVWQWLKADQQLAGGEVRFDWSADEGVLFIDIKRPGGYSLAEVIPDEGTVLLIRRQYGWMAVLNDLHMGRYAGAVWGWFIDMSAVVMLLFTLTGFWLVLPMRRKRGRLLAATGLGTLLMAGLYLLILY